MISAVRPHVASWATPRLDQSATFYAPLWHPTLAGSSFRSKDKTGHTCTVTGATWGKYGRTFDGQDDYIEANTVANNGFFGGAHTLVAWHRVVAAAVGGCILGGGSTTGPTSPFSQIQITATEVYVCSTRNTAGTANELLDTTVQAEGSTHFVAATIDADGKIQGFWVDLVSVGTGTTNALDLSTCDKFYVGQVPHVNANQNPQKGTVIDGWVFNKMLSVVELTHLQQITRWRGVT